ncbi:DUF4930 domain-containing protein [Staphylococcus felis]|nr:DUF4930 domain-containing protein [Staphylococcus felis]
MLKRLFNFFIILLLLLCIFYISLKYIPALRQQEWNPLKEDIAVESYDEEGYKVPVAGRSYVLEDNDLFRNIPRAQARNIFSWIDKYEFMQVHELTRMGYDQDYLIAEQDSQFLLYHFGDSEMRVYTTEHDLYYDLNQLGHAIKMLPIESYQSQND